MPGRRAVGDMGKPPRPDYCPDDLKEGESCHACGEPPDGVCRARYSGPAPRPLVELVLIDKRTGKVVA